MSLIIDVNHFIFKFVLAERVSDDIFIIPSVLGNLVAGTVRHNASVDTLAIAIQRIASHTASDETEINNLLTMCWDLETIGIKPPTEYAESLLGEQFENDNFSRLETLRDLFERHSILKFTYEVQTRERISFLDTMVFNDRSRVTTAVYKKPTDTGGCPNYNSICPDRYKIGVIKNFLHRTHAISSCWDIFMEEVDRIKQMLV